LRREEKLGMFVLPTPDYEALPRYREHLQKVDEEVRTRALQKFLGHFQVHYLRHLASPPLGYDVRIGEGDDMLQRLQEDGCALGRISSDRKDRLIAKCQPYADT